MAIKKLLFIDTNIWLDFYRASAGPGLRLLEHVESIGSRLIASYQLEMEYKTNRQAVIKMALGLLKSPPAIERPGIFSDAKALAALERNIRDASNRLDVLRRRLQRAFKNPSTCDPVYKACQRLFHQRSPLVLTRDNECKYTIRRKAMRRFFHGCPPRKNGDNSFGDAFHWEWMLDCAVRENAELVIVSRDSDFGVQLDGHSYVNDHLRHEFSQRVSKKRKLLLYSRLAEALKHFAVHVTRDEEAEEEAMIRSAT